MDDCFMVRYFFLSTNGVRDVFLQTSLMPQGD